MPTPDFSKIWASSSPLPAYTFSDEDYVTGWDFVGSAPPTKNEFDAWFRQTDQKLKWLYDQVQTTASQLYPIGSVYISFNSTDPSTLFGGVWQRLKDTFLLVNGDQYAPNTTGGSATKSIAVSNLPAHNHTVSSSGSHTHSSANVTVSTAGNHSHTASTNGNHSHTGIKGGDNDDGGSHFAFGTSTYQQNSTTSAGSHTHTIGTAGNHTHTVSIASSGSHTHTTENTGGSVPLNIMPPYTTVYAWRRTA